MSKNFYAAVCVGIITSCVGCEQEKDLEPTKILEYKVRFTSNEWPMAISPKGQIAAGCWGEIHVFDVSSESTTRIPFDIQSQTSKIAISDDGRRVAAIVSDFILIFDVSTKKEISRNGMRRGIFPMYFHLCSDQPTVYYTESNGDRIKSWNYEKNTESTLLTLADFTSIPADDSPKKLIQFTMLNKDIILAKVGGGVIHYDIKTKSNKYFPLDKFGQYASVSKDESLIALSSISGTVTTKIYDTKFWKLKVNCERDSTREVYGPCQTHFTHDGKYLILCTTMGNVRPTFMTIYQVSDGKCLGSIQTHKQISTSLVITPDDKYIVTSGFEGAKFWDFAEVLKHLQKQ
jgi:WD40 repeat protein